MFAPPSSLEIGPISIKLYSICIFLAVLAGYLLARRRAVLYKITKEQIEKLLPYPITGGLIGARLYHVADEWHYYKDHIPEIFAIWQGGIAIYGCIIGGVFGIYLFTRRYRQPFLAYLDLLAPSALLGQAIGRWGNYFNQEAFGPPTSLPWKMYVEPPNRPDTWQLYEYFHPLFLYESLLNFIGLGVLLYLAQRYRSKCGFIFGAYLVMYGVIRLLVEQLRFDTAVVFGIRAAILLSVFFIVTGAFLVKKSVKPRLAQT